MENLLNTDDAANYLGVASTTLRRSRWSGTLCGVIAPRFIKLGTKTVRYERDVLNKWLADCTTYDNTAQLPQSASKS